MDLYVAPTVRRFLPDRFSAPMSKKKTTLQFFKAPKKASNERARLRTLELNVEKLSAEGRGLGFIDGKAHFVLGALPGERVRARVTIDKKDFAEAELLEVLSPSELRQTPACKYFGRCGGCQLQMLAYSEQVAHKQEVLERLLSLFGDIDWSPPLTASPWTYRQRARLTVSEGPDGTPSLGFKSAQSHRVVAIDSCPVLAEPLQVLLKQLPELLAKLTHWQRIREIVIAVDAHGQLGLSYQAGPVLPDNDRELLAQCARDLNFSLGADTQLIYAVPSQDLEYTYQPEDFTQVNSAVNDALVELCLLWLAPNAGDTIADYFCGLGNFSLTLAKCAGRVVGLEGVRAMVERAQANAANLGLKNIEFIQQDLFTAATQLAAGANKALLDPPRAGAKELCQQLAHAPLESIVYVSCNPQTLLRDLAILKEGGFAVRRAALADMFPHTGHIEAVVLLSR